MDQITVRAHIDNGQIVLDEPFEFAPDAKLIITVLPESWDEEKEDWAKLSLDSLSQAYGDDEPEYPFHLIKEANPDYEGK
jgi:hypothetical protein